MITVGIDLAAQSTKTALCQLEWTPDRARIAKLSVGVDDDVILDACSEADRVGVDVPFGWPIEFLDTVIAHSQFEATSELPEWSQLRWRATDRFVHAETGIRPLSVSTDKIAATALRWAGLERKFRTRSSAVIDRSGAGKFVEVYPAAALLGWGMPHLKYKRAKGRRVLADLVSALHSGAPYLNIGQHRDRLMQDDDAFDALICSLVARATHLGMTKLPGELSDQAAIEGWIHLPVEGTLRELVGS